MLDYCALAEFRKPHEVVNQNPTVGVENIKQKLVCKLKIKLIQGYDNLKDENVLMIIPSILKKIMYGLIISSIIYWLHQQVKEAHFYSSRLTTRQGC